MEANQDTERRWNRKDLIGIEPLDADEIRLILDTAKSFVEISQRLQVRILSLAFIEPLLLTLM